MIKINWRPVVWGYAFQFIMAILVLRWYPGYTAVKFISDWITKFINYALDGAAVVFGDPFMMFHLFAFMVGKQDCFFKLHLKRSAVRVAR